MKIESISGNNIELTPGMEEYVRTRIEKLSKIVQSMEPAVIRAEVGEPSSQRRKGEHLFYAELSATIKDKDFHAIKTGQSVFKAMERVRVDMYQQIIRWKTKERVTQRKQEVMDKKLLRSAPDKI
ncbi:ribosome-associated translation inhibitor RaiA [Candidatus Uhrbacteria bacterium]|nr:ribosome-associated translation inhibitor RaiA [Candidatus Uhrbacteria bacterium]